MFKPDCPAGVGRWTGAHTKCWRRRALGSAAVIISFSPEPNHVGLAHVYFSIKQVEPQSSFGVCLCGPSVG